MLQQPVKPRYFRLYLVSPNLRIHPGPLSLQRHPAPASSKLLEGVPGQLQAHTAQPPTANPCPAQSLIFSQPSSTPWATLRQEGRKGQAGVPEGPAGPQGCVAARACCALCVPSGRALGPELLPAHGQSSLALCCTRERTADRLGGRMQREGYAPLIPPSLGKKSRRGAPTCQDLQGRCSGGPGRHLPGGGGPAGGFSVALKWDSSKAETACMDAKDSIDKQWVASCKGRGREASAALRAPRRGTHSTPTH